MKFRYKGNKFNIVGVSQQDLIYNSIIRKRHFYELDLLEYMYSIRKFLQTEKTISIDVGANIGNHSIFMSSFLSDHLVAFEPNPDVLNVLKKNLSQNITNYTLLECALGKAKGTGSIVLPENAKNNVGMAKIDVKDESDKIEISTLDNIINNLQETKKINGNVSIIKIDVKGMEIDVLKGSKNTILKDKPEIFVEAATNEYFNELNDYLSDIGYKSICKWAKTPVYHFSYNP
jgi:FkbM family methyltransferase